MMFHTAVVLVCLVVFAAVFTELVVDGTALLCCRGRRCARRRNGDVDVGVGVGWGGDVSGAGDLQILVLVVVVLVLVMRLVEQVEVGRRRRRQGQVVRVVQDGEAGVVQQGVHGHGHGHGQLGELVQQQ